MQEWLENNPAWSKNALLNQAVREFVTHPHQTVPVRLIQPEEASKLVEKMIKNRANTLDKLK